MKYTTRTLKICILPENEPIFSEMATDIEIQDEASGEFVVVRQHGGDTIYADAICITPDDWPEIKAGIEQMLAECREEKGDAK
jgi:hypothetical protein